MTRDFFPISQRYLVRRFGGQKDFFVFEFRAWAYTSDANSENAQCAYEANAHAQLILVKLFKKIGFHMRTYTE